MLKKTIVILLALLILSSLYSSYAQAPPAWNYSETLEIISIGEMFHWKLRFQGGNITLEGFKPTDEIISSVTSFSIILANTSVWKVEYDALTTQGFGLVPFDNPRTGGILLKVNAPNPDTANKLASLLNTILKTAFTREHKIPNIDFYSHANLGVIAPKLISAAPKSLKGLLEFANPEEFLKRTPWILTLQANREGGRYIFSLEFSSFSSRAYPREEISLFNLLPDLTNRNASRLSNSTTILLKMIGANAHRCKGCRITVFENQTSLLESTIPKGQPVVNFTATIGEVAPIVIATRTVDRAEVDKGKTIEVRVRLRNLSPKTTAFAENITINEEWWKGRFELVGGNASKQIRGLGPDSSVTTVYELRALQDGSEEIHLTGANNIFPYSYLAGNKTVQSRAVSNSNYLYLNKPGPSLTLQAVNERQPITFMTGEVVLFVSNPSSRTAFNVRILRGGVEVGKFDQIVAGGSRNLTDTVPNRDLRTLRQEAAWSVAWTEAAGVERRAESNILPLSYNAGKMESPNLFVKKTVNQKTTQNSTYIEVTLVVSNSGPIAKKVVLTDSLPKGIVYVNGTIAHRDGVVQAEIPEIVFAKESTFNYLARVNDTSKSYLLPAAEASLTVRDYVQKRDSGTHVLPLGIQVTKSFTRQKGFPGSSTEVNLQVANLGPLPIFDLDIAAGVEPYVRVTGGNTTAKIAELLPGTSHLLRYTAMFSLPGKSFSTKAKVDFVMATEKLNSTSKTSGIRVYDPPAVTLEAFPDSPVEGSEFTVKLSIRNRSEVPLSNISLTASIPQSIHVTAGDLRIKEATLPANASRTVEVKAKSTVALTLNLPAAEATYSFDNENLKTESRSFKLIVREDIGARYLLPITVATILLIMVAYAARRRVTHTRGSQT